MKILPSMHTYGNRTLTKVIWRNYFPIHGRGTYKKMGRALAVGCKADNFPSQRAGQIFQHFYISFLYQLHVIQKDAE